VQERPTREPRRRMQQGDADTCWQGLLGRRRDHRVDARINGTPRHRFPVSTARLRCDVPLAEVAPRMMSVWRWQGDERTARHPLPFPC